jgi:hypothetical protein
LALRVLSVLSALIHIRRVCGGDGEYYDIYINRYSKLGVTVWNDRAGFWWWRPREETEPGQTSSKYEAIDAAESGANSGGGQNLSAQGPALGGG